MYKLKSTLLVVIFLLPDKEAYLELERLLLVFIFARAFDSIFASAICGHPSGRRWKVCLSFRSWSLSLLVKRRDLSVAASYTCPLTFQAEN